MAKYKGGDAKPKTVYVAMGQAFEDTLKQELVKMGYEVTAVERLPTIVLMDVLVPGYTKVKALQKQLFDRIPGPQIEVFE